jgi:hypothetical protein
MSIRNVSAVVSLLLVAQPGMAENAATGLPLEMGGIAAVAAASLIVAVQLAKRRK